MMIVSRKAHKVDRWKMNSKGATNEAPTCANARPTGELSLVRGGGGEQRGELSLVRGGGGEQRR